VTLPRLIASWGVGPHEVEVRYFEPDAATFVTAKVRYTATTAEGATTLQLSDLWWGGAPESGWGMSVFQHGDRLFNVWFVYGEDTQPTWFVQSAGRWQDGVGSYFEGAIYSPGSAPWFAYDASRFDVGPEVGRGSVSFNGPDTAFSYFYEKRPLTLSPQMGKSVQRQPFGQGVAAPIQDVADLWWGGPSQNGWGLAIHERAGTLFMVWFTYDASGRPTWFVMPGGRWTATGTYEGTVYRTKGPYWGGLFDASRVTTQAVGTFELRFASANAAQMDLVVEGRSLALPLVRQGF
jgi:hypothetical protein